MAGRHELSDEQWAAVGPLPPGKAGDRGRTAADNRLFVNAVLWVLRTGAAWRDLPPRYGNWNSAWRRFDRWAKAGRWAALAGALGEPDLSEIHVDSTSVRAHQAASTGRRRPGEKSRRPTSDAASAAVAAG